MPSRSTIAVVMLLPAVALTACGGGSSSSSGPVKSLGCTATVSGTQAGRSVVTYADQTHNSRMSPAIAGAVAAWNGAASNVYLTKAKPTASAAITFRAGAKTSWTRCSGSGPRAVAVTLNTSKWAVTSGPHMIRFPDAVVGKLIGHALGLTEGGKCPNLMAKKDCVHRNSAPGAADLKVINRLYPGPATPSS